MCERCHNPYLHISKPQVYPLPNMDVSNKATFKEHFVFVFLPYLPLVTLQTHEWMFQKIDNYHIKGE